MLNDLLAQDLYTEICHIDPRRPTARNLDDLLGYHYYTELAHSAGMDRALLAPGTDPRERVRGVLYHLTQLDNTAPYTWFTEIARAFLGFEGDRVTLADFSWLWDAAERVMGQTGREEQVLQKTNLEKVFLTNDFDDPLTGFDAKLFVPCLRTDDLVFHLDKPEIQERLKKATGLSGLHKIPALREAIRKLFEHFTRHGAKACAISLPPDFSPQPASDSEMAKDKGAFSHGAFWILAECCREFDLPFDLMIGVNRRVYENGVFQGQDLFDQRTSLVQYAKLFNAFPEVTFCVSVLSSGQNQELVSYSWIFPNVVTSGHWWYSNIPAYIEQDLRARLQAVPKTKQIGYFSDAYKLEFVLPKYNMYRRILAQVLADDFIRPRIYTEAQAMELARLLLRDNARRIFEV
jgi:glucuronate isomerase